MGMLGHQRVSPRNNRSAFGPHKLIEPHSGEYHSHVRGVGERWLLIVGCVAACAAVALAILWPHWATAHGAAILCGVVATVYFAPWFADREVALQLKREESDLAVWDGRETQGQHAARRRAA